MQSISRGTTPKFHFNFPFEYAMVSKLTITFAQDGENIINIEMGANEITEIGDGFVTVRLTETQTNKFKHTFPLSAQLKIKTCFNDVWVSEIQHYQVHRILNTTLFDDEESIPIDPEESSPVDPEESSSPEVSI